MMSKKENNKINKEILAIRMAISMLKDELVGATVKTGGVPWVIGGYERYNSKEIDKTKIDYYGFYKKDILPIRLFELAELIDMRKFNFTDVDLEEEYKKRLEASKRIIENGQIGDYLKRTFTKKQIVEKELKQLMYKLKANSIKKADNRKKLSNSTIKLKFKDYLYIYDSKEVKYSRELKKDQFLDEINLIKGEFMIVCCDINQEIIEEKTFSFNERIIIEKDEIDTYLKEKIYKNLDINTATIELYINDISKIYLKNLPKVIIPFYNNRSRNEFSIKNNESFMKYLENLDFKLDNFKYFKTFDSNNCIEIETNEFDDYLKKFNFRLIVISFLKENMIKAEVKDINIDNYNVIKSIADDLDACVFIVDNDSLEMRDYK